MPKLLQKISLFTLLLSCYLFLASPASALTYDWETAAGFCTEDITIPVGTSDSRDIKVATLQGFECLLVNVFLMIIPLAGFATFVILLVGGFQYLTSGGNPEQVKKAQSTLTGAAIGLVVTMAVWFIFRLLKTITGLNPFHFALPGP